MHTNFEKSMKSVYLFVHYLYFPSCSVKRLIYSMQKFFFSSCFLIVSYCCCIDYAKYRCVYTLLGSSMWNSTKDSSYHTQFVKETGSYNKRVDNCTQNVYLLCKNVWFTQRTWRMPCSNQAQKPEMWYVNQQISFQFFRNFFKFDLIIIVINNIHK